MNQISCGNIHRKYYNEKNSTEHKNPNEQNVTLERKQIYLKLFIK